MTQTTVTEKEGQNPWQKLPRTNLQERFSEEDMTLRRKIPEQTRSVLFPKDFSQNPWYERGRQGKGVGRRRQESVEWGNHVITWQSATIRVTYVTRVWKMMEVSRNESRFVDTIEYTILHRLQISFLQYVICRFLRKMDRFCTCYLSLNSLEGDDHVTMTGHVRAGMGHRS